MSQSRHTSRNTGFRGYISFFAGWGLVLILLPGCSADGLRLITQLEARAPKAKALEKREMCFDEFVNQAKFEACYRREVFSLIADECVIIRATEPIAQEDCEDFLYRIVMKPDSFFPEDENYEGFPEKYRSDNLHPVARQGGCEESETCRDKCRDMFETRNEKEACYEYAIVAVTGMKVVFDALKDPSLPNLRGFNTNAQDLRTLRILFGIGADTVINKWSTGDDAWDDSEKKIVLSWLAESSGITEIFKRFDSDFVLFTNIVEGANTGETVENLNKGLGANDAGDNFVDKLLEENNETGLEWLHDYITQECDTTSNEITNDEKRCMFAEYYCEFDLHNNNELDFFEYDFFTKLLDNILEFQRKSTGAPSWWDEDTRSADLEPDQWQNGVCDNLNP